MDKYLIDVRRWYDRINGNTYHSLQIRDLMTADNAVISTIGITYGYGEAYKKTAYDELIKLGRVKKEDEFNHELNRSRYIYIVRDGLKRDMYK